MGTATGDEGVETDTGFKYNPSTGQLEATTFKGSFDGTISNTDALSNKSLYTDNNRHDRIPYVDSNGDLEIGDRIEFYSSSNASSVGAAITLSSSTLKFTTDLLPNSNNSLDLGSENNAWKNLYINDLNMSNKGKTNDVDGTWGEYTIQEGENDLYLLNRRNGKTYKFNLTEVG